MSRRWASAFAIACAASSAPLVARADADEAKVLYDEGTKAYAAGNLDVACPKFKASFEAQHSPAPLFMQAKCEMKAGKLASASTHFREVLGYEKLEKKLREEAAKAMADMEPRVPRLAIRRGAAPAEAVAKLDGAVVSLDADPIGVDPGEHELETTCPGHEPKSVKLGLGEGDKKTLDLELGPASAKTAATPATATATPSDGGVSPLWIGAGIAGGVGVLGFVAAGVTGGLILSACDGSLACTTRTASDPGDALVGTNVAGWVVGGVGVGVGVVLVVLAVTQSDASPTDVEHAAVRLAPGPAPLGVGLDLAF